MDICKFYFIFVKVKLNKNVDINICLECLFNVQ
jgi:hypothetical protein